MSMVLDVYSRDRVTFYGTIAEPHDGFDWSTSLDGEGGGRVIVDAAHADAALLVEGRMVVVRDDAYAQGVAAGEVAAWLIEEFGEEIGDAWVADSVHGPDVYAVLEESVVEPERGIGSLTTDKRWFGAMSDAYDDSLWPAAFSHGTVHEPQDSQMPSPHRAEWPSARYNPAGLPEDFPDPDAEKLWDGANVDGAGESPAGWTHHRREFYVGEDITGALSVMSDNTSETFLDGIPTHAIETLPGFDRTYTETVTLEAGWHVLYGRARNARTGPAFYGFSLLAPTAVDPNNRIRRSHTWVGHPTPCVVLGYPATPPGMTPGAILDVLLTEAQARGELAGVTWDFDGINDSGGTPWPLELEMAFSIGQTYGKIAAALGEIGCDVYVTPDLVVRAFVQRGQDRSTGPGTVDLTAAGVAVAPSRLRRYHRPRTRYVVRLEGEYAEVTDTAGAALYGVRTEFLSLGGMPKGSAFATYLSGVIAERSGPVLDTSMTVDPTVAGPYVAAGGDFDLGDFVLSPAHRTPAGMSMRVLAVGGAVDAGGVVTYDLDLGG